MGSKALSQLHSKSGGYQFWVGLMMRRQHFFWFGTFGINDNSHVRFWHKSWLEMPHLSA